MRWEKFIEEISNFTGVEINELRKETMIYEDLGMDSLGLFSLGMHLIKVYDVKVPLAAVASIESLDDIYSLLEEEFIKKI
jgi:acyl carrier protein